MTKGRRVPPQPDPPKPPRFPIRPMQPGYVMGEAAEHALKRFDACVEVIWHAIMFDPRLPTKTIIIGCESIPDARFHRFALAHDLTDNVVYLFAPGTDFGCRIDCNESEGRQLITAMARTDTLIVTTADAPATPAGVISATDNPGVLNAITHDNAKMVQGIAHDRAWRPEIEHVILPQIAGMRRLRNR